VAETGATARRGADRGFAYTRHENTDSETLSLNRRTLRLALLLVVAAAAFAATAGGAAAKTPCGEKVIDDWYGSKSGQLRHTYPLHCYRDAIKIIHQRPDLDVYSSATQDILFALQQAIAFRKGGGPPDVTSSIETADALPSFYGGPDAKYGGHAPPGDQPLTIRPIGSRPCNPACGVLNTGNSSASSVPLPAIVLGAIALLLLSLGSAAYLARRRQLRRQTLRPRPANGRNP
jgi:hypothetical protein